MNKKLNHAPMNVDSSFEEISEQELAGVSGGGLWTRFKNAWKTYTGGVRNGTTPVRRPD